MNACNVCGALYACHAIFLFKHFESSGGQLTAAACEANTQSKFGADTGYVKICK